MSREYRWYQQNKQHIVFLQFYFDSINCLRILWDEQYTHNVNIKLKLWTTLIVEILAEVV